MYLLKELNEKKAGEAVIVVGGETNLDEILNFVKLANEGMVKYLDLVPPKELEAARSKFTKKL
jgi:hypothetical protein